VTILPAQKQVFVVDDDLDMLVSMRRLLEAHGFETRLFESAAAFLEQRNYDQAFCGIFDINLGDVSGIDLRRGLAGDGIVLPIIYVTGNDNEATRTAALESGCVAYLIKPFAARSLVESVKKSAMR